MGFINEAVNDFYKQQTFYSSAKKHLPELKKQIIASFRKNGAEGFGGQYGRDGISYDNLSQDPKQKRINFRDVMGGIEVDKTFFTVGSDYSAKMTIPRIDLNGNKLQVVIKSNEEFFETGHDVEISIRRIDDKSYGSSKKFTYKINLMRPVPEVLKDLWAQIKDTEQKAGLPIDDTPKTEQPRRKFVKSDIQRIVSLYLDKQYKTYKSGKKVEIEDYDKKPVTFYVDMKGGRDKTFDSKGRGQEAFTLRMEVRKLKPNTKKTGSGYRSSLIIKPELAARFPEHKEWSEILRAGKEEITGITQYSDSYNANWLFGEKSYGEEHMKIWNRLQGATRKFIKLGYFPVSYQTPYKAGEASKIEFKKDNNLIKKIQKDPNLIDRIMNNKKYGGNLKKAFFYKGQDPNTVYERCIIEIFENWKKK